MGSSSSGRCLVPMASRGLRVLLVDQDTSSLMHMASVLEEQFYKVRTTELASVALSMIQEGEDQFDLVMANTNMRGTDIFTFLSCILLKKDMSIIFMSSDENMDTARKVLSEGACFFLQKPIRDQDLINVWQHVYRKRTSQKIKNQKADNEKKVVPIKDAHGRKIVKLDSMNIVARNNLHGNGNNRLPIDRGRRDEQNKDGLLDGDRVQELLDICKEQMTVEKVKQGESNRIQRIKTMEKASCSRKVEAIDLGLAERGDARDSLRKTRIMGMEKGKQGISNRKRANNDNDNKRKKRGDFERSNSKGLKSIEDDCSERKNTGNSNTKKKSRMKWTPALHLKFMEAICALGEKAHPKVVLGMMNEPNLTVRNVASHLQKYKDRVNQINNAADSPEVQPKMTGVAYDFNGSSEFHAQDYSMVHSQGFMTPNLEIGAAATQFTSPVSLPNPGLNVGTSVHYSLEKLTQALVNRNLTKNTHSPFPNNFNGVQVTNNGELHGLNKLSATGAFSNATNPSANQKDEQSLGFDGNTQDLGYVTLELDCPMDFSDMYESLVMLPGMRQQNPVQEWNPPPYNLQNPNQFPMALPQLTQETNFLQGLTAPASSERVGIPSTSFADMLKLLEGDEEIEIFNGKPEEEDIDRYIEWLGTPADSDNDLPK